MSETLKKLTTKFNPHKVPQMLADLCEYWDNNTEFFAGSFEVSVDEYDGVKAWFRNVEEGYSKVKIFGHDGIGSLFGLWLHDGITSIENAPIVYLGGEGEGTTVLANDFTEFFSILATNKDYEPFDANFCNAEMDNRKENSRFRKWLLEKYNISAAKSPLKVVKLAKSKHPDLSKWKNKILSE